MDDIAPKPPLKPAKAGRRAARGGATSPYPAKYKPAHKAVAPTPSQPDSVADVAMPVVPDSVVAAVIPAVLPPEPAPVAPVAAGAEPAISKPTPEPIVAATTAPIAPPAAKEVIMETIENVTAKTQTAFADATAQTKGAVEKSQKMFEDANEFGKGNIEAMVESSKIAVRGLEALGQDAAAFAKKSFEEATVAAKTMTAVKSPTDFFKLQSDYARSAFEAMMQQTSRNTEAMLKLAGEVAQPLSNRMALATEKMKIVA